MTNIIALTDLCNWNLKSGSHEWPGPNGGTCINEAAIVAAGFEYKSVSKASDCPPCFSPVVSAYLIQLNDNLNDVDRQQLIRFVTRLSGSRDTDAVEQKRLEFIVIETVRRIVPIAMDAADLPECATECRAVQTLAEALTKANIAAFIAANAANESYRAHRANIAASVANIAVEAADAATRAKASASVRTAIAASVANIAVEAADAATRAKAAIIADHAVKASAIAANAAKYAVDTATVLADNARDIASNAANIMAIIADHAVKASGIAAKAAKAADEAIDTATALAAGHIPAYIAANASTMIKKALTHHCIEIVEGALAIGNQATDIDAALVVSRMAEARTRETA